MKNIVILISGSGSNMEAIVKVSQQERWAQSLGARVVAVISNKAQAAGLERARALGVTTKVIEHSAYSSREAFDHALAQAIDAHEPALVVLAGFMRILTPAFVAHFEGRLLNIHPSLLPAFPGLNTHQRAIDAVHAVTTELDHGHIHEQSVVPVLPGDSAQDLAERVLATEHLIYPKAIKQVLSQLG
jgi:phosphoribosylglycinamide formyltransferase 1